ncbi:MAG TPA: xylulokinase [Pseudoxanthomonas sp.]
MTFTAGIDAGTQGVKVVVYDDQARRVVASKSAALDLISGEDGSREQHPDAWTQAIRQCFAGIDGAVRSRIRAIAVSGQQHGFVPLDAEGEVLAPAKLWCDTSSAAECAEITETIGGAARCIELAGNPILAGYTASKLPWTRKHRPEAYRRLAKILLPHDYLNFWLTGETFCEFGDASGTGWLDVRTRRWSPEMLRAIDPDRDLSQCLPPLVDTDSAFVIRADRAEQLGVPGDVLVATGGGDNMMAAIGTGCVVPGRLSMSLGTSGTLFAYSDSPEVDPQGRWAAFCSSTGGWLPLICTMNCTVATETIAKLFGFSTRAGDSHIQATEPGAGGITLLPFLNGERTPDLPLAKGALTGLTPHNASAANFYRAAMEGATYTLKYGYEAFVSAGMRFERIVLTGGGAGSAAWRQMVADVFGVPVRVPRDAEGAAFGAALQALWSLSRAQGGRLPLSELVDAHVGFDDALACSPRAESVEAYQAPYRRFLDRLVAVQQLYSG